MNCHFNSGNRKVGSSQCHFLTYQTHHYVTIHTTTRKNLLLTPPTDPVRNALVFKRKKASFWALTLITFDWGKLRGSEWWAVGRGGNKIWEAHGVGWLPKFHYYSHLPPAPPTSLQLHSLYPTTASLSIVTIEPSFYIPTTHTPITISLQHPLQSLSRTAENASYPFHTKPAAGNWKKGKAANCISYLILHLSLSKNQALGEAQLQQKPLNFAPLATSRV